MSIFSLFRKKTDRVHIATYKAELHPIQLKLIATHSLNFQTGL